MFAQAPGAMPVSGDFNGDGRSDIALVGGAGWTDIKIAYAIVGGFNFTSVTVNAFPIWAQTSGAKAVSGDFNGDGLGDIAMVGGNGWDSVPVAFAKADGTFNPLALHSDDFPALTRISGAQPVSGDFDGDGKADIALVSGAGWNFVAVGFSRGEGTFRGSWPFTSYYPDWSRTAGAKPASY
jgi:FG-GAP-like repeat